MKKRILSVLMTLCMVLTLLPVSALAANDGDRDHFIMDYQPQEDFTGWTPIATADDLNAIRNDLDGYYYLTGDIDLSGQEWTPIGTQSNPFTGFLYGCGYSIRNLTITQRGSLHDFGLFGAVSGTARLMDLALENVNIDIDSDTQGSTTASNVGALAGYAANRGGALYIYNCYVTGNVAFNSSGETSAYIGGLVGRIAAAPLSSTFGVQVASCYNRADIAVSASSSSMSPRLVWAISFIPISVTAIPSLLMKASPLLWRSRGISISLPPVCGKT